MFCFLDRTKLEVALQGFFFRQIKIRGCVSMFCFQTEQNKRWCFNVFFSDRTKLEVVFQCFVFRQNKIRGTPPLISMFCFSDRTKLEVVFQYLFFRQDKIRGGVSRLFFRQIKIRGGVSMFCL
jgi:hypothetical protein